MNPIKFKQYRNGNIKTTLPANFAPINHGSGKLSGLALAMALLLGGYSATTSAAAFDSNIVIRGSAEFDSFGSPASPINATQTGSLTSIIAGSTSTTTLNGSTVTGPDPLSGTLSQIGDGFGISLNASGTSGTEPSGISPLFGDYTFSIENKSAMDSFIVSLQFQFSHQVEATDTLPANDNGEFAQSLIAFYKADGTELAFSKVISDTVFGNEKRIPSDPNTNIGSGKGGPLSDVGTLLLSFLLNPGDLISFGDSNPDLRISGGADSGRFSISASSLITVDSVTKQTNNTVPEPETLWLLAIGLVSVLTSKRRSYAFN
ncbi:PEP-CTERM sorting domain-containing protein [Methylomonas sp. 2BW1-5-20]|uniref:PEP-CTERM sorting domain-containing protein n=1 Tax=Methylomonas sp. 2BW1-5-20 TaxID=3376686 RepID=UPI00404D94CC